MKLKAKFRADTLASLRQCEVTDFKRFSRTWVAVAQQKFLKLAKYFALLQYNAVDLYG